MIKKQSALLKPSDRTHLLKLLLTGIIASCIVMPIVDWSAACGFKCLAPTSANAQRPTVLRKNLAVDQVSLKSGDPMYGIVTAHKEQTGTTIVVERKWFELTYPAVYAKHLKAELASVRTSAKTQLVRLKDWKEVRADDEELVNFIDGEIARVEKLVAEENKDEVKNQANQANEKVSALSRFTQVTYAPKEVRRVFRQSEDRHKVAGVAWMNQIENVTKTAFTDLKKQLTELNVEVAAVTVDLSSEVAAGRLQSDNEWNARKCVIEYVFRKRMRYQGMGSKLVEIDPKEPAAPEDLIAQTIQGGMFGDPSAHALLKELLGELNGARPDRNIQPKNATKWWKQATDGAEREGSRAVRVTRLTQEFSNPIAKVDEFLLAEISPGNWVPIFKVTSSANRNEVKQADIDFLKQDAQVEHVIKTFNSLGGGNDQLLDTALRQGVATQEAMAASSDRFYEFLNRFSDNTDGPKLELEIERQSNR